MKKQQQSVEQTFEYKPILHLIGFPDSNILHSLESLLSREVLLREYRREVWGKKIVDPSFNPNFIEERQTFFKTIGSNQRFRTKFFEEGMERFEKSSRYRSREEFLESCNAIYEILETSRNNFRGLSGLSEVKRILSKVDKFDSNLGVMLDVLKSIESMSMFAVDAERGAIVPISEMPSEGISFRGEEEMGEDLARIIGKIRLRSKAEAIKLAREIGMDFKEEITRYIRSELKFREGKENLRRDFERLAVPIRLNSRWGRFLKGCSYYNLNLAKKELDFDGEDDWVYIRSIGPEELREEFSRRLGKNVHLMPATLVYPSFKSHYDLNGLFPPKLIRDQGMDDLYVPLDFKTKPSENKFLIAGLHSGGKSFFLENLVLASIVGQIGLSLPSDSLTLPKFQNIYYYRNVNNNSSQGKLETELTAIKEIIDRATKGDLVVIDEFLDSTSAEIANSLGSFILDRLVESKATVFVTSHRNTNYTQLAGRGWVIMSPDYEIKEGKVNPTHKLVRRAPDEEINKRYITERYGKLF